MQYRDKHIEVGMVILDFFYNDFDTVLHNKPLYKLKHYGINGNTHKMDR